MSAFFKTLPASWRCEKLKHVADFRVSNVDTPHRTLPLAMACMIRTHLQAPSTTPVLKLLQT